MSAKTPGPGSGVRPTSTRNSASRHDIQAARCSGRSAGFTITEIMVALLLAGLLAAALFYFFTAQQRTYGSQVKALSTQTNLWAAIGVVQRALRFAGAGWEELCPRRSGAAKGEGPSVRIYDAYASGTTVSGQTNGPDRLRYLPFIRVVNGDSTDCMDIDDAVGDCPRCPYAPATQKGYSDTGSDCLIVFAGNPSRKQFSDGGPAALLSAAMTSANPASALNIDRPQAFNRYKPAPDGFQDRDFVLFTRPAGTELDPGLYCSLLQITSCCTPLTGTTCSGGDSVCANPLPHSAGTGWLLNPPASPPSELFPAGGYPAETRLYNLGSSTQAPYLLWSTFVVATGGRLNLLVDPDIYEAAASYLVVFPHPRIYGETNRDEPYFEVIAEGIEDMQLTYGCDADGDGVIGEGLTDAAKLTDEWGFNVSGELDANRPACATGIQAVRVSMVARTSAPDAAFTGAATSRTTEDHVVTYSEAEQHYRRRAMRAQVSLRGRPL